MLTENAALSAEPFENTDDFLGVCGWVLRCLRQFVELFRESMRAELFQDDAESVGDWIHNVRLLRMAQQPVRNLVDAYGERFDNVAARRGARWASDLNALIEKALHELRDTTCSPNQRLAAASDMLGQIVELLKSWDADLSAFAAESSTAKTLPVIDDSSLRRLHQQALRVGQSLRYPSTALLRQEFEPVCSKAVSAIEDIRRYRNTGSIHDVRTKELKLCMDLRLIFLVVFFLQYYAFAAREDLGKHVRAFLEYVTKIHRDAIEVIQSRDLSETIGKRIRKLEDWLGKFEASESLRFDPLIAI